MKIEDQYPGFRGSISCGYIDPVTAEVIDDPLENSNSISYAAAGAMAHLVGGDFNWAPRFVGFIYGPSAPADPELSVDPRDQDLSIIAQDVAAVGGNMIVVPLLNNPAFASSGSSARYADNSVTRIALSDRNVIPHWSGPGFKTTGPEAGVDQFWQAVMLCDPAHDRGFRPFARAPIGGGRPVLADFELSLFWNIIFK